MFQPHKYTPLYNEEVATQSNAIILPKDDP